MPVRVNPKRWRHEMRVAHSRATVSDEFNDPFSTAADYGQLAEMVLLSNV